MIRVTYNCNGDIRSLPAFGSVEAFEKFLRDSVKTGGEMIVRVPDDETMMRVDLAVAKTEIDARKSVTILVGSTAFFWTQRDPSVEGMLVAQQGMMPIKMVGPIMRMPLPEGWVMYLVAQNVTSHGRRGTSAAEVDDQAGKH